MSPEPVRAERVEQVIRAYIRACNDADPAAIAACFHPDAVHYFPSLAKWVGAAAIGSNFAQRVHEDGHCWTVDQLIADASKCSAALEWTRFDRHGRILRGVDWFIFEAETLRIQEVRPYTAAPVIPEMERQELREFNYAERGYPTARPLADGQSRAGTKC